MAYEDEMVRRIGEALRESEVLSRSIGKEVLEGGVFAFLDDVFIFIDDKVTEVSTPKIEPIFTAYDSRLNISKSAITGRNEKDFNLPEGWKVNQNGKMVVGVPIGRTGWKRSFIGEKIK